MFIRINKALNAKRDGLKKDEGFTLIELLVVVLIIGILAAIAIPVFLGVQDNAKKAAVTSDLTNAKTAIIAYFTDNPSATALTDATLKTALTSWGYTPTPKVTLTFGTVTAANPSSKFCINGAHSDITGGTPATAGGIIKSITAEGGVADTKCP